MTTAAEFLTLRARGLRADREHVAAGRLHKDLSEAERMRMEGYRIAADVLDEISHERLDELTEEHRAVVAAVAADNHTSGHALGLREASRILTVRMKVARWPWQVPPLRSARDAVDRLCDQVVGR